MAMAETIIWISGATSGIGLALARNAPFPGTRIISLSRTPHPDYETVHLDLTEPDTYAAVGESFRRELAGFTGKRAIFIHNAMYNAVGYVGEVDPAELAKALQANAVAPQLLGDMFLRAVGPGYESGLVQMSSAAARLPYAGMAAYSAVKAGIEIWVKAVLLELADRGRDTWVTAVRPGFVDTPGTRTTATRSPRDYPAATMVAQALEQGGPGVFTAEQSARLIWEALETRKHEPLLYFGTAVTTSS